ncbi:MAG TPA: MBOAT family protein [Vicinamibacterales bacterium]
MTEWPRWSLMWMLALAVYATSKALTWRTAHAMNAPKWRHAAYLFAWPGMDATAFMQANTTASCCRVAEWLRALFNLIAGILLLFVVARTLPSEHVYVAAWSGMVGLILMLHFGAFHLLSCFWRRLDLPARPLMNRPLASKSLSEFWGRRWNTAFRDLAHRFVFRPLTSRLGPRVGLVGGFLVSGLVHDLVISVPAGGGYGGPTMFFVIQGAAISLERSRLGKRMGLGRGTFGRSFVFAAVIAPLGLLFHRPFVIGVIVPFMHAIGALP